MRPSSVSLPVPTTTPVARPETTRVPENAMLLRSPTVALADTGLVDLSVGTASPVSAASSARRFFTSVRRRSAGTLSPDSSSTTSPGTNSSAGIRRVSPPTPPPPEQHRAPPPQPPRGDQARLAAAPRAGLRREHVADGVERLLRPALLNE